MDRNLMQDLIRWKDSADRKPLVLRGARQTGKTWLMKAFGAQSFASCAYFNFDEDSRLGAVFEKSKEPRRLIELLSILCGKKIIPGETLLILDEIQECPAALNALKYFREQAASLHVIAAGSLLGTALAHPHSYPVGQVNLMELRPLAFGEFLAAVDPPLFAFYQGIRKGDEIEDIFHEKLLEAQSLYFIVGGMPECVSSWAEHRDPEKITRIQRDLCALYESDITKHNGRIDAGKILQVLRSIPSQLARENEKFIYGAVREGARARDFETAIEWLASAGLVNRLFNVSAPLHPLPAYDRLGHFKLFFFDTGLLKCLSGTESSAILLDEPFAFKGALAENYVLQQLRGQFEVEPRYFASPGMEIDFLVQAGSDIIPIEAKAGSDKSAPSFKRFVKERSPRRAIRFSKRNCRTDGAFTNLPLYLAPRLREFL